jgi:hypothetical protein
MTAALVVVLVHGSRDLSRRPRQVPEAASDRPPSDDTSRPTAVGAATAEAGPRRGDDGGSGS